MKRRYLAIGLTLWLLVGLACATLTGGRPTETPAAVVGTPTLASTATLDPNATPTDTALVGPTATNTLEADATVATQEPTPIESVTSPTAGGGDGNGGGNGDGNGNGGGSITPATCPASGQNLLTNPSFEGPYEEYGGFPELNRAPGWTPWWTDGQNNQRPEYKPVDPIAAPNRIHSGSTAQQYFKSFGLFKAGLYQSVLNVAVGSRLQFSAHGQAWSCEDSSQCPDARSFNPANMLMRVGIEPSGGTDPFADTIVWSAYFNPLDQWQAACVETEAERDLVTVFVWSSPNGPRQNQDVYWDDASLVVLP